MTSFGAKIREKMNRMSGDSSVTKEAMGDNGSDWHCDSCKRSWAEDDKAKPDLVECSACQEWFCQNCTQLKKNDMNALNRDDMFWACSNCLATVKSRLVENKCSEPNKDITTKITEAITEHMKTFETRLEKRIEQAVSVEIPKAVEACTQKATEEIDNSVTTCLEKVGGEVTNQMEKCIEKVQVGVTASVDDMWTEVVGRKKQNKDKSNNPGIITTAMKRAMLEQKTDDLNRDERMKNFVVYRLPESAMDTAEKRKEDEAKKIKELLSTLSVDDTPTKFFRIGKFDEKKTAPRPMKVIMETCEAQNKVMSNLKKLSTAEQHLKDLSISYDMTNEERALVKDKVEEAKEKTKNSKNWVYKIRGPYWNLREIRVRKPVEEDKEEA